MKNKTKENMRQKWIEEGGRLLAWREELGLSRAFIARETRVDYGRLSRLEKGDPVKEARLVSQVYRMTLEKVEMEKVFKRLQTSIGAENKGESTENHS